MMRARSGFGEHVRSLRNVRRLSQEDLAKRAKLASDTIRRLEGEEFSPSLRTLTRVVDALGIRMSTLFLGLELDESAKTREFMDLLAGRSESEIALVFRLARDVLHELDAYRSGDDGDHGRRAHGRRGGRRGG